MSVTALHIGSDNVGCRAMFDAYIKGITAGLELLPEPCIVHVPHPVGIVLLPSEAFCRGR